MIDTNCKRKFRSFVKRATVLAYYPIGFVIKFKNCNLIEPCSVSIVCPGCVYLSHSTSTQKAFYYLFRVLIYNMPSTSIWCIKKINGRAKVYKNSVPLRKRDGSEYGYLVSLNFAYHSQTQKILMKVSLL